MKVLITGAGGLVGRAVVKHSERAGESVRAFDHSSLDITNQADLGTVFARERPDVVINCAAWTDVDGCELDPEHAQKANAEGPEMLALACRKAGTLLITISTDYVFDGKQTGFYTQRDQPNPQSIYAVSKLAGERRAQNAWARTIVVRSGYIFGHGGTNFLSTILTRARRGERVRAIRDCFGTPTYADDLAKQLYRLMKIDLPGIYHIVNSGKGASFESFAREVFAAAALDLELLESISLNELNRPAPRPRNSRLRCLLTEAIGLEPLPNLQDSLRDFVEAESRARPVDIARGIA